MTEEKQSTKKKQRNEVMRYTGVATKMAIIIGVSVYSGIKLDEKFSDGGKLWTVGLALIGTVFAVYQVIKDLIR
ncbi:MAG: hypothetical protein ACI9RU_001758 [Litorivivens sp.]|jgi:hypothetical protein